MAHRSARLAVRSRLLRCRRIEEESTAAAEDARSSDAGTGRLEALRVQRRALVEEALPGEYARQERGRARDNAQVVRDDSRWVAPISWLES